MVNRHQEQRFFLYNKDNEKVSRLELLFNVLLPFNKSTDLELDSEEESRWLIFAAIRPTEFLSCMPAQVERGTLKVHWSSKRLEVIPLIELDYLGCSSIANSTTHLLAPIVHATCGYPGVRCWILCEQPSGC